MAKSQENGITILLGLEDYSVREVMGSQKTVVVQTAIKGRQRKCPYYGSAKLYRHGLCKPGEILHTWSNESGFILSSTGADGSAVIVNTPLLKAKNWCAAVPGLPGKLKPRPCGSLRTETSLRWEES